MDAITKQPLRLLYLEDSEKDAELVRDFLSGSIESITFTIATSKAEYLNALARQVYDDIADVETK